MISEGLGRHRGGIELQPLKTFRPNRAEDGANGPNVAADWSRSRVKEVPADRQRRNCGRSR